MSKREKNTLRVDSYLLYLVKIAAIDQNVLPRDVVEQALQQFLKKSVHSDK
jgi:hypothetical protein